MLVLLFRSQLLVPPSQLDVSSFLQKSDVGVCCFNRWMLILLFRNQMSEYIASPGGCWFFSSEIRCRNTLLHQVDLVFFFGSQLLVPPSKSNVGSSLQKSVVGSSFRSQMLVLLFRSQMSQYVASPGGC